MSLLSPTKIKKSPLIYAYILIGSLSSLLILLLIRQSLPYNKQISQEYYQNIKTAKQDIAALDKLVLQSVYQNYSTDNKLENQSKIVKKSLKKLEILPDFFNQQQQNLLLSKLETKEVLLNSQLNLINQLTASNIDLNNSCQSIYKQKHFFQNNLESILIQSELLQDNFLENLFLLCFNRNNNISLTIKSQLEKLHSLFKENNLQDNNFLILSLIEKSENILEDRKKIAQINNQLEISDLYEKLIDYETIYLNSLDELARKIQIYRLISYLAFLMAIIFIAYKVINNLIQTNRNIVKILESFTQELETKVEQRTALLEESIQNTEAALAQAQNANKAKSRFLANMSHELRTPLNAILGFTQLMCRDASISKEHQENIQIINRSGEHLLKLINDILEMSKIEVGQITLNETKFDLYTMLKSIEEMLRLKARVKQLDLSFTIHSNVPKYIHTDEGKLRQILINLLGNALKFTDKGVISLQVKLKDNSQLEEANIDFLFTDTHLLHFAVTDTGPGILEEEMEQLFSPFEQTQIGRSSNEGTGLGLSICQKFVELMGGKLEVTSTVGKGTTFSFGILIKSQDLEIASTIDTSEIDQTHRVIGIAANQPQYRVLAVDDVPASRLLLKKILTEVGFAVEEASNGKEAINLFASWHPHLILMDMRMPIMDGYEATKQIKSLPNGKETVIIALTASAFEEERVVILSAGCDDFMRKPFYEAELLNKIGQYLGIDYIYEANTNPADNGSESIAELTPDSLAIMPLKWRSQLYDAAARVDNQEILQLLADIPQEYETLAKGLTHLVEHFRCDKIIDLTKSVN